MSANEPFDRERLTSGSLRGRIRARIGTGVVNLGHWINPRPGAQSSNNINNISVVQDADPTSWLDEMHQSIDNGESLRRSDRLNAHILSRRSFSNSRRSSRPRSMSSYIRQCTGATPSRLSLNDIEPSVSNPEGLHRVYSISNRENQTSWTGFRTPSDTAIDEVVYDTSLDNSRYIGWDTDIGIPVPHPRRYLLESKEPEDFMMPEQRDTYFKQIEEFQKQWDQGGSPNPPDYRDFLSAEQLHEYYEHAHQCRNQGIRYWKMRTRAWFLWLDMKRIPFRFSCPRRGMPTVTPIGTFDKDPAFEAMEEVEDNIRHYDEFRWTANQQALMGNPRRIVPAVFPVPATSA